jgi:heme-degrading monooxygenase HmoA
MFSVIFEVNRKPDHIDEYLDLAKELKPILQKVEGFVDNERFESQLRQGWLLSHSTWRDEKSVVRWRTEGKHHGVQEKGRFQIFEDYHLRVGEVVSDTAPPPEAPIRELRLDETETGVAKYATFTEITPQVGATLGAEPQMIRAHLGLSLNSPGLSNHDVWKSITVEGKLALLCGWKDIVTARAWRPSPFAAAKDIRHRIVRVVRDYGMYDRREAPQYYPDVPGRETQHAACGLGSDARPPQSARRQSGSHG